MTAPGPASRPDEAAALASAADHQLAAELAEQSAALLRALRASGIDDPDVLRAGATAARTSCLSPNWRRAARLTRCCPRKAR